MQKQLFMSGIAGTFAEHNINLVIGVTVFILVLALLDNKKLPAALAALAVGIIAGLSLGGFGGLAFSLGPTEIRVISPSAADFWTAFIMLILAQIPLTIGNACVGTADTCCSLFPKNPLLSKTKAGNFALTMGIANLPAGFFGAVPMCHGTGGLAAHYRWGEDRRCARHDRRSFRCDGARLISPATIDRLLGPIRDRDVLKQRYQRKPHAAWLRKAVPVQSYHDKPLDRFGYVEVDTVMHSGNTGRGQFCVTVTATEVDTGWTELRAVPNRAQAWVTKALQRVLPRLPFTPTELHTDNGGEFINRALIRTTSRRKLKQTRSRAYHKNDAPYVESKNGSLVRAYVGYRRYETRPEFLILRQLAPLISLRHNLFMPTMKFQASLPADKPSDRRRRTIATPYHRPLVSKRLSPRQCRRLSALHRGTDYFKLTERIATLQRQLDRAYQCRVYFSNHWPVKRRGRTPCREKL